MPLEVIIAKTSAERETCFEIRKAVFVAEQAVPLELELDEYDASAIHFLMRDSETQKPLATARLLNKSGLAKIGRVAVLRELRGQGFGMALMQAVLDEARRLGFTESILDSQTYAVPFYERLGFVAEGEEFDDAGIAHLLMRKCLGF